MIPAQRIVRLSRPFLPARAVILVINDMEHDVSPKVSVLLCVYNGALQFREALDSVLAQTFRDFELIVVDDGSTDSTPEILRACSDRRLVVITQAHMGLTRSLNRALAAARGQYIARQDADDLSRPDRLEKQVAFLDGHPEIALVGSGVQTVDERGQPVHAYRYPTDDAALRRQLLNRFNPLPHTTVMFRRSVALALSGWDERFVKSQDYEFYLRLIEGYRIASLPEPLCTLRYRPDSFTFSDDGEQLKYLLLAYALAVLRRERPDLAPPRDRPLPLAEVESWYQASRFPRRFRGGELRRAAQVAGARGQWGAALRQALQALWVDPDYPLRRLRRRISPEPEVADLTSALARQWDLPCDLSNDLS